MYVNEGSRSLESASFLELSLTKPFPIDFTTRLKLFDLGHSFETGRRVG